MSSKYRAVGAIVIIVSVMVAWGVLMRFDDNNSQLTLIGQVPPEPNIEAFAMPTPAEPVVLPDTAFEPESHDAKAMLPEPARASARQPSEVVKPAPKPSRLIQKTPSGHAKAWVLQVASFKTRSNAQKLQQLLLADDLPAYVKAFNINGDTIHRVLVGPKLSKDHANTLSKKIASKHKLRSLMIEYKPGFAE